MCRLHQQTSPHFSSHVYSWSMEIIKRSMRSFPFTWWVFFPVFFAAKGDVLQPADPWLLRRAEGMKPRCCPVEIPQTRWWGFQYLGLWLNIPFLRTNALSKTPQKGRTNFSEGNLHVFYAVSCKMWRCVIIHDWFLPYIYIYILYICIY